MKKALFIDNTAHHLFGQLHNINAFSQNGYKVILLVPDDGRYFSRLQELGFLCIDEIKSWKGKNPFYDLGLIIRLKSILKRINPDIICSFTIKPNLYTALANREKTFKQVANITGLGYAFMGSKFKAKIFYWFYRFAFKSVEQVFFQNQDDYFYFNNLNILRHNNLNILPGSGVDLKKYHLVGLVKNSVIRFLYSGRLIADKGIFELISAFKKVRKKYSNVELIFIGNYFPANPSAISPEQIKAWCDEGVISYLGMVDNVPQIIADCDCVVLPSYREGMPRTLLEASAMGKPVITVNSIGCKDAVEDGVTGFIAKVKDAESLTDAIIRFIELPFEKKIEMGLNGRRKMEQEFDQQIVINKYLEVAERLLNN